MNPLLAVEIIIVLSTLSLLSYKLRILDIQGTILAAVIGGTIYLTVGRVGIILLTVFVVIAGLITKLGYDKKSQIGAAEPRKGLRSWRNVAGNGVVAAAAALIYAMAPGYSEALLGGFIGAVSAVFADTMATEVGLLYKGDPRLIIGFKRVKPGTPGGVTILGYGGALLSACILVAAYLFSGASNPLAPHIVILAAVSSSLIGTTIDSVIGQFLQGLYVCDVCGKTTEYKTHCGRPARLVRGFRVVDNHVVNVICSLAGALMGFWVTTLLYNTV